MNRALASFAILALAVTGFHGSAEPISPHLRQRMTGVSWHRGCPVGFDQLRLLRVAHVQAQNIVDTVREPLLVLDGKLCVVAASRSFFQVFCVDRDATLGRHLYELGDG